MNSWYKYLPLKHAKTLVEVGTIRIGTLYDYRRVENHGHQVGDQSEGWLTEWSADQNLKSGSEANRLEKMAIQSGPEGTLKNNRVELQHESPDLYLFCASRTFRQTMSEINNNYGDRYDTCVIISNPGAFVKVIVEVFEEGEFIGCFPCQYMSRCQHYAQNAPHPALIKDLRYKYQTEVRTLWKPKRYIEPRILEVPEIRQFCTLLTQRD